jgi:hypothetical protein
MLVDPFGAISERGQGRGVDKALSLISSLPRVRLVRGGKDR